MIHINSIHSQFLLPSPLKPKYITPPNKTVRCVCADSTSLADIYYKLEWKYTSLCFIINNLLLPNYITFVYACAEWIFYFSRLYKYFTCNLNILKQTKVQFYDTQMFPIFFKLLHEEENKTFIIFLKLILEYNNVLIIANHYFEIKFFL